MSTLVCVAILQCRVYDIAMVTAVYLHLNLKKVISGARNNFIKTCAVGQSCDTYWNM